MVGKLGSVPAIHITHVDDVLVNEVEARGSKQANRLRQNGPGKQAPGVAEADMSLDQLLRRSQALYNALETGGMPQVEAPATSGESASTGVGVQQRLNEKPESLAPSSPNATAPKRPYQPLTRLPAKTSAKSSAEHKTGKSWVRKLYERPVAATIVIPGMDPSTSRPHRNGVPPLHSESSSQAKSDSGLEEAKKLVRITESLLETMPTSGADIWERPAPSTARRVVTKAIPWLAPKSLRDVATFTDKGKEAGLVLGKANAAKQKRASSGNEVSTYTRELLDQADKLKKNCDDAIQVLELARQKRSTAQKKLTDLATLSEEAKDSVGPLPQIPARQYRPAANVRFARRGEPARQISSETVNSYASQMKEATEGMSRADAVYKAAESALLTASQSLNRLVNGTDLLQLASLQLTTMENNKSLEFSMKRLDDIKTRVSAIRADAGNRQQIIELEIEAATEEMRMLQPLGKLLDQAEESVEISSNRLNQLRAQRLNQLRTQPAAVGSTEAPANESLGVASTSQGVSSPDTRTNLQQQILQAKATLADALLKRKDCSEQLKGISARSTEINVRIGELLQERNVEVARLTAADSIDLLLATAPKATEEKGKVEDPENLLDKLRDRFDRYQAKSTPSFPRTSPRLQSALTTLAERASSPLPGALAPHTVLQIVTEILAEVTDKDMDRAVRVLDAMQSHPVTHWVKPEIESPSASAADAVAICRKLASLPRGSEIIEMLSSSRPTMRRTDTTVALQKISRPSESLASHQLEALEIFWKADSAAQTEADPKVVSWLGQAKRVASATLAAPTDTEVRMQFDDVDHAAFNAVRNGYYSNAPGSPYDQHNQRLNKANNEWIMRQATKSEKEQMTASGGRQSWVRKRLPHLNKTPYTRRGLNKAYEVGESMGMVSPRIEIDRAVNQRIDNLKATITAVGEHSESPNVEHAVAASKLLVEHLEKLNKPGEHLSELTLRPSDASTLWKRLQDAYQTGTQPIALPKFITEICAGKLSAYDALAHVEKHLHALIPDSQRPQDQKTSTANDMEDIHVADSIRLLKQKHFTSKEDVVAFFRPFILNCNLRNKLLLAGGGNAGANIPSLPYSIISPIVSPIFSCEAFRTDEAYAQLFMPIIGIEMSFGKTRAANYDVSGGAAAGPDWGPVRIQVPFVGSLAHARTKTDATLMRFFRSRGKDDEMRANMLNALDSMVRWDQIQPERGRSYGSPLEAIFARNPKVSVGQVDGNTTSTTIDGQISARLPFAQFDYTSEIGGSGAFEPSYLVEATRTYAKNTEHGGQTRIVGDNRDIAEQRTRVGLNLNGSAISDQTVNAGGGAVTRHGLGPHLSGTRDLTWSLERNSISPFTIGGKQDSDLDREYATPADMVAEIKQNREQWLMRCIETLESDEKGNKDNSDNRIRAAILLDEFQEDIEKLSKDSKYCYYNVNYSMKPASAAAIDGYRALGELAMRRGDAAGAQRSQQAIEDILQMRATWRPLMLIVREKAHTPKQVGWRPVVRWQKVSNVDGQRTVAQFPPP